MSNMMCVSIAAAAGVYKLKRVPGLLLIHDKA